MPKNSSAAHYNQPPWMQGAYAAPMGMQTDYAAHTGVPLANRHRGNYMVQPVMYPMPASQPQAVPQYVTVPVSALHMNGHSHGHKSKKQRAAERLNAARKLLKGNSMDFTTKEDKEMALNSLMSRPQIQVHGVDELKVILSRYIDKKHWLDANVETIVSAMTTTELGDFIGEWTPAKFATKHPKFFRKMVKKALQSAKSYVKRHVAKNEVHVAPPAAEKADARFTSMRF